MRSPIFQSCAIFPFTAPQMCNELRLSDVYVSSTEHSITLMWDSPDCNVQVGKYEIYYSLHPRVQSLVISKNRVFTLSELEPGKKTEFSITPVGLDGIKGVNYTLKAYTS